MPEATLRLTVSADSSAVAAASAWVRALGDRASLPPGDVFRLDLCVSELVTNVASYGYTNGADATIELCAQSTVGSSGIRVEVIDRGAPFDPLTVPAPMLASSLAEAQIGGFGIHLVRRLADECAYRRAGERNVFTLVINPSTAAPPAAGDPVERGADRRSATEGPYRLVIDRLKSSLELEALRRELGFARQVQSSMVPEGMTVDFSRAEARWCGYMRPARQVGGDFYDAFYVDSNRLVVVMGDVCGKGMPAALFMARTLTLLRSEGVHPARRAQRHHTLELVERTNQQLCRNNNADYFASVFAAMLDLSTGVLTWVNCGHPPPALARGSSEFRFLTEPRGMLLGVSDEPGYEVGESALPPGSVLLLYTDGLTEAENPHGIMFGQQRLIELLNNVESRAADAIVHSVVGGVEIFAQGRAQGDDLTLFALSYAGER